MPRYESPPGAVHWRPTTRLFLVASTAPTVVKPRKTASDQIIQVYQDDNFLSYAVFFGTDDFMMVIHKKKPINWS